MICRFPKQTILIVTAQRIVPSAKTLIAHGGRNGQMVLILKIALIGLAIVLGLSIFDVIVVGLVYLARVGIEKKESEEKKNEIRIENAQTAEVKPIKYGRWIKGSNKFGDETLTCSNCGDVWTDDDEVNINVEYFNFCPKCGADMRKEREEEE